jgi:hypothetical protein
VNETTQAYLKQGEQADIELVRREHQNLTRVLAEKEAEDEAGLSKLDGQMFNSGKITERLQAMQNENLPIDSLLIIWICWEGKSKKR